MREASMRRPIEQRSYAHMGVRDRIRARPDRRHSPSRPSRRAQASRLKQRPIEKALRDAHSELLEDPQAIADLLRLADIRDACYARPHWPGAIPRYWNAVERSPLRERFAWSELDHLASIIRARLARGVRDRVAPADANGAG
jgi:hypothetical protein